MSAGGQVNITIVDGGSATLVVPGSSVQLVLGCCSSGTANQIIATRTPSTLTTYLGVGPLVEAAALTCLAGGTVLAMKIPGAVAGSAGTVTTVGGGTSIITVTGTPNDTYYVLVKFITGGTIASAGITFQVSLDAGRSFNTQSSPTIVLGTANTYAIPGTGLTLNFAAGTILANQTVSFSTNEPYWNTAGVQAGILAFQASSYALGGVGSIHVVGSPGFAAATGPSCSSIQGYLDTLANTGFIYQRAMMASRDASPAAAYSGTGETEQAWMTALQTDYSGVSARRMLVSAGYWNMPSAYPNPAAWGTPRFRRPVSYALAARAVAIPPQQHSGRVKTGNLSNIVVDSINDPTDGFVYHDERVNPGLDYITTGSGTARFATTLTRIGYPGVFSANPLTMAPIGSDFFLLPLGNVFDVFCSQFRTSAQLQIDDDVRVNTNGTIYENDAQAIEAAIASSCNAALFSTKMISSSIQTGPAALAANQGCIAIDRTVNVKTTSAVTIVGQIVSRGYVLTINAILSFQNPLAAA